ncbi:MAG: FAD-binding oxidoreductase, partial [Gemmatimonadota bacterium]|nr:FAD-binding oxidoreductase [Gemmatimonadota bacterium]
MTGAPSPLVPPTNFRGVFRDDAPACAVYSEAAGIERIMPRAVAIPADYDDVVAIVHWARARGIPITPRGSGTSMGGGAIGPGVIVDLGLLNQIGPVDVSANRIAVGPGALRSAVNSAATEHGLRFPVDPSSGSYCTLGGMVATNAAGAHSLRFGSTRRWVAALDCVFADGSRAILTRGEAPPRELAGVNRFLEEVHPRIVDRRKMIDAAHRGVRKESSGYGLSAYAESGEIIDLLIGSEGTLAIVVGVELSLVEVAGATRGVLGAFPSLDSAVVAASTARSSDVAACELLERTFLDVAAAGRDDDVSPATRAALMALPEGTAAVLLADVEGETAEVATERAEEIAEIFRLAGSTQVSIAGTDGEQHGIWELRHAASPILARLDPALKSMQFIEDGAVPPEKLADYVRGVRAALDVHGVRGVIFGHAGDGHVHVNPLIDVSKPEWRSTVEGILEDVVMLTSR